MRAYIPEATQGATRFSGATLGSTNYGLNPTNSGVANTKGSWLEIVASTVCDGIGLIVCVRVQSATWYLIDIGIGAAGSEKVLIPNLLSGSSNYAPFVFYLPIRVPAGSRLSARFQSDSTTMVVAVNLIVAGGDMRWARMPRCSTIGVDTSISRGTLVPVPGSVNTKGAWVELSAAISHDFHYCVLMTGTGDGRISSRQYLLDIGVGASGSETAVLSNLGMVDPHSTGDMWCPYALALPMFIPSGSRVSARMQVDSLSGVTSPRIALLGVDA